jgi:LPXTG-motif cell wall-anchored protein
MDKLKFDALTRAFATGTSRRTAIKGLFGGAAAVAVATTRLDRTGAQGTPCSPGSVEADCGTPPDECTIVQCLQGTGTEQFFCSYTSECGETRRCCDGGYCAECCDNSDCGEGTCSICDSGICVSTCNECQECEGGICADLDDGVCCDGTWYPGGQCCSTGDCIEPVATFCSSVTCLDNLCTVVPECPDDQQCCGYGAEGAYCAQCCDNDDCYIAGPCSTCEEGWCTTPECCVHEDCDGCEVCGQDHQCHPLLCEFGETCCDGHSCIKEEDCCRGIGDSCGLLEVSGAWDGSEQLDCCDGLVCCENWNSQYPVCAECCNDWDCPKGAWCNEGWCEFPDLCDHDKDCPKGTCCCKDGSCSGKCCHHHHPKPPKPPKPAPTPETPVTTLPATGSGESADSTGLFGAAALGAAAALYAAKKMRENPEAQTEE